METIDEKMIKWKNTDTGLHWLKLVEDRDPNERPMLNSGLKKTRERRYDHISRPEGSSCNLISSNNKRCILKCTV